MSQVQPLAWELPHAASVAKKKSTNNKHWRRYGKKRIKLSSVMSNLGYTGHHINSVKNNGALGENWKGDPRNIVFLENPKHPNSSPMPNAYNEHFHSNQGHRGSTTNVSRGRLIDRETMINQFNKGCKI